MDTVRLFWIAVIGSALLSVLALLVIAWAMARSASMEPPAPPERLEQEA